MKKISLCMSGAVLALAACTAEKKTVANDDLKKDLELASSSEGLGVGTGAATKGTQVVSAIERTAPAPKAPALSSRAHRYHRAPTQTVAPVTAEAPAAVAEPEPTSVAPEPVAVDPGPPVSPRPRPQTVSYPGGNSGDVGSGSNRGSIIGAVLGAVIRGAVVGAIGGGGDVCDPRTDGRGNRRGGTTIWINQRMPGGNFPRGTFPR